MNDFILEFITSQGIFALLFTFLLLYILKSNIERENKYYEIVKNLLEILDKKNKNAI